MTPDKATVEMVAKAIRKSLPEIGLVYTPTCSWGGLSVDKVNLMAIKIAAALPTPTDASGVVEALEDIAGQTWDNYVEAVDVCNIVTKLAAKALAQHREGKPWSDRPNMSMEYEIPRSKVWRDQDGKVWIDIEGQWYGPITPPEGS